MMEDSWRDESEDASAEHPTWQVVVRGLWRCNHASFKGRLSIEAFEDLLTSIEESIARKRKRPMRPLIVRRIKARNVRRIQRLERALFKIAGCDVDHGNQFFCDLNRMIFVLESDRK